MTIDRRETSEKRRRDIKFASYVDVQDAADVTPANDIRDSQVISMPARVRPTNPCILESVTPSQRVAPTQAR